MLLPRLSEVEIIQKAQPLDLSLPTRLIAFLQLTHIQSPKEYQLPATVRHIEV